MADGRHDHRRDTLDAGRWEGVDHAHVCRFGLARAQNAPRSAVWRFVARARLVARLLVPVPRTALAELVQTICVRLHGMLPLARGMLRCVPACSMALSISLPILASDGIPVFGVVIRPEPNLY